MMSKPLQVLIVEDLESDAALVARVLRKAGHAVHDERVETADEMRAALEKQAWDVVISDFRLPQFDAPAALALLQGTSPETPFIVVSGTIGEDTAVAMMKFGAHDYLMKDKLSRLAPAVEREMREAQTRRERKRAEQALVESNAQFRTLFQASPDAIMLVDAHEHWPILDCNAAACQMNGYSRDELIGQSVDVLNLTLGSPGERAEYLERIRRNGVLRLETFHRRKDGIVFPVEVSTSLITLGGRDVTLGIDRDITERKRAEEKIREQLEELERWHDLTLDRETRTLELKHEVNELLRRLNEPARYPSAEA
jgi:PAS domain S-box-containing protein